MKTPYWWHYKTLIAQLLRPLSLIWRLAAAIRAIFARSEKLAVPVWCVGNVAVGGGGKTPFCLYLGQLMKQAGVQAYFIGRGYGGKLAGPCLVDPEKHDYRQVGDEALLLARLLPTVIARRRIDAARYAVEQGAELLIMDDGLQYPHLHKDKSFLLLKGNQPLGNGYIMPAGPLRESLASALSRSDIVVQLDAATNPLDTDTNSSSDDEDTLATRRKITAFGSAFDTDSKMNRYDLPVWSASTKLTLPELSSNRVLAFCGIAHPELFTRSLQDAGLEIVECRIFADHHPYTAHEMDQLVREATSHDITLITTQKDAVRIPAEFRDKVAVAVQTLTLTEQDQLTNLMQDFIPSPA